MAARGDRSEAAGERAAGLLAGVLTMIPDDPISFARQWEAAWNRRDVEAVLAHFHEHALFTSPVAQRIGFAADGAVRGKDELRRYWTKALAGNPDLRFQVVKVFEGADAIVILYLDQHDAERTEVLVFRDGLISEGRGTISAP